MTCMKNVVFLSEVCILRTWIALGAGKLGNVSAKCTYIGI